MTDQARQPAGSTEAAAAGESVQRSLRLNTVCAIGGVGFFHACQLAVLVLLAKFATPEIQGQYIWALAIASPVVLFLGFQLRAALVADAGNQFTVGTYLTLRSWTTAATTLVLGGVLIAVALAGESLPFLFILGGVFAARIAWTMSEAGWGTFQRRERLDLLALAHVLRGLALVLPLAVLLPWYAAGGGASAVRLGWATAAAMVLAALGYIVIDLAFDRPLVCDRRRWDLSWSRGAVWRLAAQAFPLGVVALAINLCDSFPRLLVESQPDGKAQLGYFGALAYITLAGNLVVIQAANAAANRLAVYYQRDLSAFLKLGTKLVVLAAVIGTAVLVIALSCGAWLLRVLYTAAYAHYVAEFQIVVLAHTLALLTNVFGAATTQMRLFWVQVPVQIITLGSTVVAAIVLIPGENLVRGAAETALVRAIVQLVLYAVCVGLGIAFRDRVLAWSRRRGAVDTSEHG